MERHCNGEHITYDVSLMAFPDPSTKGRFITMIILYMQIPGSVLGSTIANTALVEPHLRPEQFDDIVHTLINATLAGRSQELEQMQAQQEQALAAGRPAPTGGSLLTP